ncbi:MAG: bifunctional methylenetetrahydrofolate dehydrogenase/methenyltetrahydrofolate cyclohydrolase FolD [Alphaproteobacteria bacterium]
MTATLIDGKGYAAGLNELSAKAAQRLKDDHDIIPGLAVINVGDDPASKVYTRNKVETAQKIGIHAELHQLPPSTTQDELLDLLDRLNKSDTIHSILVQLPLPPHIEEKTIIDAVTPEKDIDGFHTTNVGRLVSGLPGHVPCTPVGCMLLLRHFVGDLTGKDVIIIGRSHIVGRPLSNLLVNANATVTIAHSRTRNLAEQCRNKDIVIAAVGLPEFIQDDWIKPGAVVLDVGINRVFIEEEGGKSRLVGDVCFEEVSEVAGFITPVPGGIGPMTVACLVRGTVLTAYRMAGLEEPRLELDRGSLPD